MTDIRSHAEKVREAAEGATPGPWEASEGSLFRGYGVVRGASGETVTGAGSNKIENASLIALTASPEIARAVWEVAVAADRCKSNVGDPYWDEPGLADALDRLEALLREREEADD